MIKQSIFTKNLPDKSNIINRILIQNFVSSTLKFLKEQTRLNIDTLYPLYQTVASSLNRIKKQVRGIFAYLPQESSY